MMMTKPLMALIFDVDGTLADTEEAHRIAFNQTFETFGLEWHWSPELYTELLAVAGGKERILHYINAYQAPLTQHVKRTEQVTDFVATLHRDKTQRYQMMLRHGDVPLRPGVKRLLREAHDSKLKLAIATTTSMTNVDALLASAFAPEVRQWFDMIAAGDMVEHKKPSPDIYQCALAGLGLTAEYCIAFEDSVIGAQAATAAGLHTIITTDRYSRRRKFGDVLIVLDKLGEPDDPIEVLKGDASGHRFVDLALVRELHTKAYAGAAK